MELPRRAWGKDPVLDEVSCLMPRMSSFEMFKWNVHP